MEKSWFDLKEIRKRRLADAVWIPLRASELVEKTGTYGYPGFKEEFFGLGSVAIPVERREEAEKLGWIELSGSQGTCAGSDFYKPADIYRYHEKIDLGVELVVVQNFETEDQSEWHLGLDLVIALALLREGDKWVRPAEDYCEVARLRRDGVGHPVAMEIKSQFLRDYLCARNMLLRTAMYRSRAFVVEDAAQVGSPQPRKEEVKGERYELSLRPLIEGGYGGDGSYAVLRAGRNDVDPDDDVPNPGPWTDASTESEQRYGKHDGRKFVWVLGELWREEDIEPAANSERTRGDKVPSGIRYIVGASGQTMSSEELDDESKMRWIWFRPEVIPAITKRRSGSLRWYTQETGGVGFATASLTHFGLNRLGLVNVYAYDIAKLPVWEQRIWVGHNVAPESGVSVELISAQAKAVVAQTIAPEAVLPDLLNALDDTFRAAIGAPLFRPHPNAESLIGSISRFRALE